MSLEEKFHAAVNVIRSLPKSGSYQPSNELMLRFYSYFKQATEGTCSKDKPGFWDVVNRAKWEAWNKLGDMTKDDAMEAYVTELHKIVETMSYNSDVASFLSVESSSFPSADLRLAVGAALAPRGRADAACESLRPAAGAALAPRGRADAACESLRLAASATLAPRRRAEAASSCSESSSSSPVRSASPATTRTRHDSDDEFIDTVDVTVNEPEIIEVPQAMPAPRLSNGHAHQITSQLTHLKVLEQLPGALSRLEADVAALRKAVEGERRALHQQVSGGWRWPWQELSPPTLLLLLAWPLLLYRLAHTRTQGRTSSP